MSEPKHPRSIVLTNKYYPNGLIEKTIWDHYMLNKVNLLAEIGKRPVLLFIFTDINDWIVRRNLFGSTIQLTNKNYEKIITGRTVSISVEREKMASYLCVDIDAGEKVTEITLKDCIRDLLNSSLANLPIVTSHRVVSTARSYHVYFYLNKKMEINMARTFLEKMLSMDFTGKYLINSRGPMTGHNINLDLTPTTYRGSHTVVNALCRNGLIAKDVTENWETFNKRMAILKK